MTTILARLQAAPYAPVVTVTDYGYQVQQTYEGETFTTELHTQPNGHYLVKDGLMGEEIIVDPAATGYESLEFIFEVTFG